MIFAILSMVFSGLSDYFLKRANSTFPAVINFIRTSACLVPVLLIALANSKFQITTQEFIFCTLSGICMASAIYLSVRALAVGEMGIVIPIIRMAFVGTIILDAFYNLKIPSFSTVLGLLFAVAAIIFLCLDFPKRSGSA